MGSVLRKQSNGVAGAQEEVDGYMVETGYVEAAVVDTHVLEAVLEGDGNHQDDMAYISEHRVQETEPVTGALNMNNELVGDSDEASRRSEWADWAPSQRESGRSCGDLPSPEHSCEAPAGSDHSCEDPLAVEMVSEQAGCCSARRGGSPRLAAHLNRRISRATFGESNSGLGLETSEEMVGSRQH